MHLSCSLSTLCSFPIRFILNKKIFSDFSLKGSIKKKPEDSRIKFNEASFDRWKEDSNLSKSNETLNEVKKFGNYGKKRARKSIFRDIEKAIKIEKWHLIYFSFLEFKKIMKANVTGKPILKNANI